MFEEINVEEQGKNIDEDSKRAKIKKLRREVYQKSEEYNQLYNDKIKLEWEDLHENASSFILFRNAEERKLRKKLKQMNERTEQLWKELIQLNAQIRALEGNNSDDESILNTNLNSYQDYEDYEEYIADINNIDITNDEEEKDTLEDNLDNEDKKNDVEIEENLSIEEKSILDQEVDEQDLDSISIEDDTPILTDDLIESNQVEEIEEVKDESIPAEDLEEFKNIFSNDDGFDIDIVLSKDGLNEIDNTDKNIINTSDLVLIHKMLEEPIDSLLKPVDIIIDNSLSLEINNNIYDRPIDNIEHTIHFGLNNEYNILNKENVNYMYAIVIPFDKINKEQIVNIQQLDTTIKDEIKLDSNCYIICPDSMAHAVKKNNPGVNIAKYNDKNVNGYANLLIDVLGYKVETINGKLWTDSDDNDKLSQLIEENNLFVDIENKKYDEIDKDINIIASTFKVITDNIKIESIDDLMPTMAQVYHQVMKYTNKIFSLDNYLSNKDIIKQLFNYLRENNISYDESFHEYIFSSEYTKEIDDFNDEFVDDMFDKYFLIEEKNSNDDDADKIRLLLNKLWKHEGYRDRICKQPLSFLYTLTSLYAIYKNKNV